MKIGSIITAAVIAIGSVVSCVPVENQDPQSVVRVEENSVVDPILAQRRTINPFLAWNAAGTGNRYGLTWNGANPRRANFPQAAPLIRLNELHWNYYFPNKPWLNYPGIEPYLTDRNWGHAAEYGETLTSDISSSEYLSYIASIGGRLVERSQSHGLMLDWWHDNSKGGFSQSQVRRARVELIRNIRDQLGDEIIILANVNWRNETATVSELNGVFLELWKSQDRSDNLYNTSELFRIESLLQYYERRLAYPRLIALNGWRQTLAVSDADRNTSANRRMAKILTAMSVVVPTNGYIMYGDNNPDTPEGDHFHLYYDFYSFDVGQPTSGYQQVSRGVGFKEHDRGVVAYNITGRDVVFETSDGREITAPANSGLFCEYVGVSERCLSSD